MQNIIQTKDLKVEDVPQSNAPIKSINEFALSFDWVEQNGQLIVENLDSDFKELELGKLRAILYGEQRRWNHFAKDYDEITEAKIRELIRVIREKLESR